MNCKRHRKITYILSSYIYNDNYICAWSTLLKQDNEVVDVFVVGEGKEGVFFNRFSNTLKQNGDT